MSTTHPRRTAARTAAAMAGAALVGLVAAGTTPATAAPSAPAATSAAVTAHGARTPSVRRALATSAGTFPTVAVVRGSNRVVYATTGSGFVNLGGQVIDDPAVAAGPNQLWFLGKGTDSHLYVRTADTGWKLVANSPVIGTSLTAAWVPHGSDSGLLVGYLDTSSNAQLMEIIPVAGSDEAVGEQVAGERAFGVAVNETIVAMLIGADIAPGLLGATGNLAVWRVNEDETLIALHLSCARDRLATASSATYPTSGVVACRSADATGSIHFLGMAGAHNLGGRIIGSPGIALRVNHDSDSVVYVTGTNHKIYSTTVTDGTTAGGPGDFHSTPFLNLGGYAAGGVQAVSFSLEPVDK